MSEDKDKLIEDMALEDEPQKKEGKEKPGKLDMELDKPLKEDKIRRDIKDMELDYPIPAEIEKRIAKLFSDQEIIYITPDDVLTRKRDGRHKFRSTYVEDLGNKELEKLDRWLGAEEGK